MRRLLPFLLLGGCANDLPDADVVANLRILGVRAEPAEVPPGGTVDLDALVVHPDPGIPIERIWLACVTASSTSTGCLATTLPPACETDPEAQVCLLGTGETARWRLPSSARTQAFVTLAAALADSGGVVACAQQLAAAGAVPEFCRVAVKRVNVLAAAAIANRNPGLDALTIDGERLSVTLAPDAVEPGESPFLSWFATAGDLDNFRTDATGPGLTNTWTPASLPGRLWVVIRDGRGGESWLAGER